MEHSSHAIVSLRNLTHYYSARPAVENVSLEFGSKGIYGLLGSNGAGKSTIMNIMCGVLKPSHGEVYINGISLLEKPELAKRYLGFLPQKPPVHGELTVKEYLRYAAGLRQMPHRYIKSAVEEVIERCMLTSHQQKMISSLSGGYQQRVGIAQAIIHKPNLVVFDEPTNGLDPNQTETIRNLIHEIGQERSVILSTHILPEVEASCDHICMVEKGQVVFDGSIRDFGNYLQPDRINIRFAHAPSEDDLLHLQMIAEVKHLEGGLLQIKFSGDSDELIDLLVSRSVQDGWGLREVYLERNSTEKVFAALSKHSTIIS